MAETVVWFPVVTSVGSLILGYFMKFISDAVQHQRQLERDRETRNEARRDQIAEQRRNFQRQTLLELQEAIFDVARTTGAAHVKDEKAYRQTGQWQKQLLDADLDEKNAVATGRTLMFMVRVRDEKLRELVGEFRNLAIQVTTSIDRDHSNSSLQSVIEVSEKVHQRVGVVLHALDDEESSMFEKQRQ